MRCIKMGQWSDCGRLLVKEARGGKFLSGKGQIGWEDGKGLKRVGWGQFGVGGKRSRGCSGPVSTSKAGCIRKQWEGRSERTSLAP